MAVDKAKLLVLRKGKKRILLKRISHGTLMLRQAQAMRHLPSHGRIQQRGSG
jgi:hypothetical protein